MLYRGQLKVLAYRYLGDKEGNARGIVSLQQGICYMFWQPIHKEVNLYIQLPGSGIQSVEACK